jgi:hypothetical protein
MKRRIVLEVDDEQTTAEIIALGGCQDAFGLSRYVCRQDDLHPACREAMGEFGITILSDERID